MTPTPDCSQLPASLQTTFIWTLKEKDPATGLYIPKLQRKNVETNYGITAYAGAFQGSYNAPVYLVIDGWAPQFSSANGTQVTISASRQPTLAGDTQLILSLGTANQETVTYTGSPSQNGTLWTYSLTAAPANTHTLGDVCVRVPLATDTMSSIFSEVAYDSTNFPNQRMQSVGGYSGGTANWVMQFFFTGTQAITYFATVGLADNVTIGQGNLHNLLPLGFSHTGTTNDLELDVSLTLSNV